MKKIRMTLIRVLVFLIVFLVSQKIISNVVNSGNTDLTTDMQSASLPVIYMNINDIKINPLHGYTSQMEGNFLRGKLTPINADRTLNIVVDTYGASVAKIAFEVRNTECSRLIESGELSSFNFNDNIISADLSFKDLIKDDNEYMLIIKLTTGDGNVIDYYTRIINTAELSLVDKLNFCLDFSDKTFDKTLAPELKKYMESNSKGDNSSFGYVNIHSSFNQLSWGELTPEVCSEKEVNLISIDSSNGCIELKYQVDIKDEIYNVNEYFRVHKGKDRMYLMEYERTMDQIITHEESTIVNNKIINGIVNKKIDYIESPSDAIVAFVQQNSLYSFNALTGNLTRIFSFRDNENNDMRTNFNGHDIKPMSIDEAGNVLFMVYGYMNRGKHEGKVGVALYNYDAVVNTIEEQVFIPYKKSHELLMQDIERLSYVNSRSMLYMLLDGSVYSINLESKNVETVAKNLDENRFVSSKDNSIIAWQTGEGILDYNTIQLYSLQQLSPEVIQAPSGNIIIPLGFIGSDLVYGLSRLSDLTTDATGRKVIPMYKVIIEGINKKVQKEYSKDGVFITDVEISDDMVTLKRLSRDEETGNFVATTDDQILTNETGLAKDNIYKSVVTKEMETTYQIVLAKEDNFDSIKLLNPKVVIFEDNREIELKDTDNIKRYYVYAKGKLINTFTDPADAVITAESLFGVVVNKQMDYIWESKNRDAKKTLEKIGGSALTEEQIESGITEVTMCLEEMLEYKEVYKDVDELLRNQETVISVLSDNLDMEVLDLQGCSLDSVLYYVNKGYPVMAMTEVNGAVLIVGYDAKNTLLYSPLSGEVFKKGMNDSKAFFELLGNKYLTYID